MQTQQSSVVNQVTLPVEAAGDVITGWQAIAEKIERAGLEIARVKGSACIGIDGFLGVDWESVTSSLASAARLLGIPLEVFEVQGCRKPEKVIESLVARYLPDNEPVFGRVCRRALRTAYDPSRLRAMAREVDARRRSAGNPQAPTLMCVVGAGAALLPLGTPFDVSAFVDLTREQVLKRNRAWTSRVSKTQSIGPRRIYYVDLPMHESHRKKTVPAIDFYIDDNDPGRPVALSRACLDELTRRLLSNPLRCKPLYEPGVWGGQWLKRSRGLPASLPNCAYGFELIAPEQSVLAELGTGTIELPFNLLMETQGDMIMGKQARKRFGDFFPIRFAYDDTWEGGNLSIQVHPTRRYARTRFREPAGQGEMYYAFACAPGTINHLGLRDGVRRRDFLRAARESEASRSPIDHTRYANVVPVTQGQIYLIPPGTLHGAGAGQLVLEISSTPYRYTFKIYDYCRPDLDGSFRPIHLRHAFKVLKFFRTATWVTRNLVPVPRLHARGRSGAAQWQELTIADRKEFYHIVRRFEFDSRYEDDTGRGFHILTLVEGEMVTVRARRPAGFLRQMGLSETVLVPHAVGPYEVLNETGAPCKVVKSLLRRQG